MMQHWRPDPSSPAGMRPENAARAGRFDLQFRRHGQTSMIGRQFISYPFHFTRPFALDPLIPSLLTVYQQSSSGGLYRGDQLSSRLELGTGAAAHVTTQAATVVHDCHGLPARQELRIEAGPDSFLACTPDPLILFPGASVASDLGVKIAEGAVVLLQDAFATHDPTGGGRVFDEIRSDITVSNPDGKALVFDRFRLKGEALRGDASPIGGWQIVSSHLMLGDAARLPSLADLAAAESVAGAVVGISRLPNEAGWCVRCLAADAIAARSISQTLFGIAVLAAFGVRPSPRRK